MGFTTGDWRWSLQKLDSVVSFCVALNIYTVILTWKVFVHFGVHDCPNERNTIKEPRIIMYLLPDFTVRIGFFSVWPWVFHTQPTCCVFFLIVFCSRLSPLTMQPDFTQTSIAIFQEIWAIWCLMRAMSLFQQATYTVCWYGHIVLTNTT